MPLPYLAYIDGNPYYIHQHNFSGGHSPKTITEEITITGKRSRQFGWGPREWQVTIWADYDTKEYLNSVWEDDSSSSYTHTFRIGDIGTSYTVTFDDISINNKEAVEERYLVQITAKEWV